MRGKNGEALQTEGSGDKRVGSVDHSHMVPGIEKTRGDRESREGNRVGKKSSHPGMPECGETRSLTEKDKCTGKIKREPRKGKKVVKYREIGGSQRSWVERATRGVRN